MTNYNNKNLQQTEKIQSAKGNVSAKSEYELSHITGESQTNRTDSTLLKELLLQRN